MEATFSEEDKDKGIKWSKIGKVAYYLSRVTVKNYLKLGSLKGFPCSNSLAMQDTWVQSLGQEDSLEKGMTTHSSILAWRIPWTEEPDELQSVGSQRVGHDWATNTTGSLKQQKFILW